MGIIALVSGVLWYGLRHVRHVRMALSVLIVITLGVRTTNHIPVYTNEKTLWEHVITNNCAPWMALNNLGVIYRDTGKGDIAQTYFKQAIVHRPNEYSIYNNLGMAYRDKKQYDLAANVLEHALPLETRGVTLYASLARVRELQGHPHQAIKLLGKATALQKGRADLWLNMGIIQMQQHLWQEAQDAIQTTLKLDPHNLNAWLALSKINKTISTPESVIDTYHQALTFLPDNTTLHNDLALLAATMGDSDLAIKHWKIAIALEPDNSMCTLNLGTLYLKRKQWDQARLWLSRTHELPLHSPSVLPKLALCLLNDPNANSADWQLAREYMLTFKQFTPPLSPADQQLLATACEAAGDYQSAINVLLPLIESLSTSTTDDLQLLQQLKAQLERCQNTLK